MGGVGATGDNRFVMSGDSNILNKSITATAPVKYLGYNRSHYSSWRWNRLEKHLVQNILNLKALVILRTKLLSLLSEKSECQDINSTQQVIQDVKDKTN